MGYLKKAYLCGINRWKYMTEIHKKYRLTSTEEPTDEMLQALMEDVAVAARESSARAEAKKQRMLQDAAHTIAIRRAQRKAPIHG